MARILNLLDNDILFLDCQTTGSAPPKACIIELGWSMENVRQRPGKLADRGNAVQVGQFAPMDVGLELGLPLFGDVADDAQNLITVAANDAGLEEALLTGIPQRVLDLLHHV